MPQLNLLAIIEGILSIVLIKLGRLFKELSKNVSFE
jgi:hypothetical protein